MMVFVILQVEGYNALPVPLIVLHTVSTSLILSYHTALSICWEELNRPSFWLTDSPQLPSFLSKQAKGKSARGFDPLLHSDTCHVKPRVLVCRYEVIHLCFCLIFCCHFSSTGDNRTTDSYAERERANQPTDLQDHLRLWTATYQMTGYRVQTPNLSVRGTMYSP
jgi:hypothetical protein